MKAFFKRRSFLLLGMPWWFLLIPFLLLFGTVLIDFNGLYGQDSHAYLAYAKNLKMAWKNGVDAGSFFWPKGYPASGALISFLGITELLALRLISFFSLIGSLMVANKLIRLFSGKDGWLFLLLGALTQIYFVRSGFLVMSDMATAFFCITAFYTYFRFRLEENNNFFFILLLSAIGAIFFRYAALPLLAVPVLHGIFLFIRSSGNFVKVIAVITALCLSVIVIIWNSRFWEESLHYFDHWSPINAFRTSFEGRDGISRLTVPNCLYIFGNAFHLGFLSIGLLLVPFYREISRNYRFLALCLVPYLLFLAGIPVQNYRFLVLTHLPVLVVLFPAFSALRLRLGRFAVLFVSLIILLNLTFGWYSFSKTLHVHRIEREVADKLKQLLHNEPVYAFYVDQSFPSYGITHEVHNFYMEDYDTFEKGAIVIFNEAQFSEQWRGHRVMNNWERLKSGYQLDTLAVLTDQWTIYRVR